jgi:PAS domain S-box-containing protein
MLQMFFCTINEQAILYVSIAAINHWGYPPEELIGKSYRDFIVWEDLPKLQQ